MRIKLLPFTLTLVAALAGCASSSSSAKDDPAAPAAAKAPVTSTTAAARSRGSKLKVVSSDYGRILADGHGRALYLFSADTGKGSNCQGDCAKAWPPYLVKSKPTAVSGAKPGRVGTVRRSDGKLQATMQATPSTTTSGTIRPARSTARRLWSSAATGTCCGPTAGRSARGSLRPV